MVDGVHTAGKGAAHTLGANAACQAASSLSLGTCLVVTTFDFGEIIYATFNRQLRQWHPTLNPDLPLCHTRLDLLLLEMDNRQRGFRWTFQLVSTQVADNRLSSFVTAGDCFDHKSSSGNTVSRGKYSRASGSKGVRIDRDCPLIGQTDTSIIGDERQTGALTNREDHRIAGINVVRVFDLVDQQTTGFIKSE